MKGFTIFIILAVLVVIGFFLFRKPAAAPVVETANQPADTTTGKVNSPDANLDGTKELDETASTATWTGTKTLIKDYTDTGTIKIKSGNAIFDKGILKDGEVVFDMNTIATTSTGKGSDSDATSSQAKHLRSADFFDVAKYPEATFMITDVTKETGSNYTLKGNLMIKGMTNPITLPVTVTEANGKATIKGSVVLDRTMWEIKYGSSKFFPNLGDKVIGDTFTLAFTAVTK
jgi:polyisoprenoid-binding protein YceI